MVNHARPQGRAPRSFRHVTNEDRKFFKRYKNLSGARVAKLINGPSRWTVNRHRKKAQPGNYRPGLETRLAAERAKKKGRKGILESNPIIRSEFLRLLRYKRKPYISNEKILKKYKFDLKVSAMYAFIKRDKERARLNQGGWGSHELIKIKDKRGNYTNTPRIADRVMIDERDPIVKEITFLEQRFCDYEMDLMHGSKGYALVIVERKSRNVFIATQATKDKDVTKNNVVRLLRGKKVLTLTCDNGSENASHKEISQKIGAPIYFCHPGKPKEKGQVERMIGLIRRDWPVTTDFTKITPQQVRAMTHKRNNDPCTMLPKSDGISHDLPSDYLVNIMG